MKNRRLLSIIIAVVLILSLSSCGKSSAAQSVDNKILKIGVVNLESGEMIEDAELAYSKLKDKEKKDVEYYQTLTDARARYDKLCDDEKERIKEENELAKEEEIAKKQQQEEIESTKNEIEQLLQENDIENAKKKIEELPESESTQKGQYNGQIKSMCFAEVELPRLDYVVSEKPEKHVDGIMQECWYHDYYYGIKEDAYSAFKDYCDYLNKHYKKTDSRELGELTQYSFEVHDSEVTILYTGDLENGYYIITIYVRDE